MTVIYIISIALGILCLLEALREKRLRRKAREKLENDPARENAIDYIVDMLAFAASAIDAGRKMHYRQKAYEYASRYQVDRDTVYERFVERFPHLADRFYF